MKIRSLYICLLVSLGLSKAMGQYHEVGGFLGASTYIGDVGNTAYLVPGSYATGIIYKWNLTTRYSLRASITQANLKNADYASAELGRFWRNYKVNNSIQEFSAGMEFNFLDFNLHTEQVNFSPYLYLGLSYFRYKLQYHENPGGTVPTGLRAVPELVDYGTTQDVAVPVIFGVKLNPTPTVVLGLEVGARYALTDNLDGSDPNPDVSQNRFGNIGNNDWYVFSGLTISFTFGDLPCYCKDK